VTVPQDPSAATETGTAGDTAGTVAGTTGTVGGGSAAPRRAGLPGEWVAEAPPDGARSSGEERPTRRDDVLPGGARNCFACGDDNPIGLHLRDIRREGEEVHATLHPRPDYMGWPGVLHGGITATALDEVMNWGSILLAGVWTATGTMDLRYRAQVPLDVPLGLVAGITEARGRTVRAWARLLLPDGAVAAESTGLLVRLPEAMAARARELYGSG
jgi:acyl-coenzyme A thioesterase PaaI-like protein